MKRKRSFVIDKEKRSARRQTKRTVERTHTFSPNDGGEKVDLVKTVERSPERAENLQALRQMARGFINTVEFYKKEQGGSLSHEQAVEKMVSVDEWRREYIESCEPQRISWGDIAAVAQANVNDGLHVWARVREAADDELESGKRASEVVGESSDPFAFAQFLAIRDSFADDWQPRGGIESAMIDMLTISFSLQMYWATIAHKRAINTHHEQAKSLDQFELAKWKSPYQSEADAIDHAHRLADGYNRQFLRVLRQLRDLRRYSPVVIQNNGGQVNVGNQQVNIQQADLED